MAPALLLRGWGPRIKLKDRQEAGPTLRYRGMREVTGLGGDPDGEVVRTLSVLSISTSQRSGRVQHRFEMVWVKFTSAVSAMTEAHSLRCSLSAQLC